MSKHPIQFLVLRQLIIVVQRNGN